MVGYIVEVIFVIGVAEKNSQLWNEAEHAIDDKHKYLEAFITLQREQRNPKAWCKWSHWCSGSCCFSTSGSGEAGLFTLPSRAHRIVSFDRLKARFIQQANKHRGRAHGSLLGSGFMLSHYLSVRQHAVLESMVELPVSQWVFMIALAIVLRFVLVLSDQIRLWLFLGFGWSILLITLAIRVKVARIVDMVTPRTPRVGKIENAQSLRPDFTEINSTPVHNNDSLSSTYAQAGYSRPSVATKSSSGQFSSSLMSSGKQSDNCQRLLLSTRPPLERETEYHSTVSASGATAVLHGHRGLLYKPGPATRRLQRMSDSAASSDRTQNQWNSSVQIQNLDANESLHPVRSQRTRSQTHQTNRLTRHESFRELLPAYREEGKVVDELFWLHEWRDHCCLRCRDRREKHAATHVPEHVEVKKWILSLMLLLNTVYVTVLVKEGVGTIMNYCSPGQEDHRATGSSSSDSAGIAFEQGQQYSNRPDGEDFDSEGETRKLLDYLVLVVAIAAAVFPPVFFLFFVVPNALLDYITVTR